MYSKRGMRLAGAGVLLASVIAIAGCGSSSSSGSSQTSQQGGSSSGKYKVTLATGEAGGSWNDTIAAGAKAEAENLGVDLTWTGPSTYEVGPQVENLDGVLASKPEFAIISPVDATALIAPIRQFDEAGIPVLTVDSDVEDKSVRLGNITSDNRKGGELAAETLIEAGAKEVAYAGPPKGISTTDERIEGFEAVLKKHPDVKYVGAQYGADESTAATGVISPILSRYPNLEGLFVGDEEYATGASSVLAGNGGNSNLKVVAFDGSPEEVEGVKSGTLYALVVQQAYSEGALAVKYAYEYLAEGKKPPAITHPPFTIATKENIDSPSVTKYLYRH